MKRNIEADLLNWKNKKNRLPLVIRGARQVGKTYIIEKFGSEKFVNCITINFERNPQHKDFFNTLDPLKIINAIELVIGIKIEFGKTLLFLDEIQECPEAIMALRYFKEELPQLHVIGAGSLLEFVLNDSKFRAPVGRVQFMFLRPLSFGEYLDASNNSKLRTFLKNVHVNENIEYVIHNKLLSLVREYCFLGGMPAVIQEYLNTKSLKQCQETQLSMLLTFRNDFGKYAKKTSIEYLQTIFAKAPGMIGKWLKYSTLDSEASSKSLKTALRKLCEAGLIILVYATSGAGIPFITHKNEKKAKFLFLDIGLVKRACNLDINLLFEKDLSLINDGALAEQFVGQELIANMGTNEMSELYSWVREKKSSSAEIDYLITVGSQIVPIEVKASAIGTLRSLKIFMSEKKINLGVRISEAMYSLNQNIFSIPFYLIEEMPRLIKEINNDVS